MTPEPLSTERARALGSPTRQAILAFIADAGAAVTVNELTDHLGVNHNAVRKHLARLVGAGLLLEERQPRTGPGRPRLLYRPAARVDRDDNGSYERLAVLLATTLASGEDPALVGRRAAPRRRPARSAESTLEALASTLADDGFEPVVRRRRTGADVVLGRCPFVAAAQANPEAVCRMHLGLAQGMADAIGGLSVIGLEPKDPRRAGCRLSVTATPATGS